MNIRRLHGFSLVEIMVALLISMLLMAGVLTIMSSSKRTYALQDELAKLQENARFVIEDVTFALRMAGFSGCSNLREENAFRGSSQSALPLRVAEKDTQYGYTLTTALYKPVTSDSLTVNYYEKKLKLDLNRNGEPHDRDIENERVLLAGAPSFALHRDNPIKPAVNSQIKISDCGQAEDYVVTNVNTSNPNYSEVKVRHKLSGVPYINRQYRAPIEVFATAKSTEYRVGVIDKNEDNDVTDPQDGVALFKDGNFFIEGVQSLKIRYGLDKNGDKVADVYATDYDSGGTVVSVRISILMRTANQRADIGDGNDKVADAGWVYQPVSGYRYRSFTGTVKVRN